MPYDYTDAQLHDRVTDGKDSRRAATADQLYQRAQAGDQTALHTLLQLSGIEDDPNTAAREGWATADAQNYGKSLVGKLGVGYTPQYDKAHDGGGFFSGLGSVLKVAAPIAGALIPGVGVLGAGLIGAGGSALGGAMHGDPFSFGKTALAGLGAAAGNKLLGNGLGGGSSNWGFGSSGIPRAPDTSGLNPAGGAPGAPGGAGAIPGQSSGGLLGRFGDVGSILQKYGPLALGAAGMFNQASQQSGADDLRNQALGLAQQDYASRAPLRTAAVGALSAPLKPRVDLGPGFGGPPVHLGNLAGPPVNTARTFADPTDPYRRN